MRAYKIVDSLKRYLKYQIKLDFKNLVINNKVDLPQRSMLIVKK